MLTRVNDYYVIHVKSVPCVLRWYTFSNYIENKCVNAYKLKYCIIFRLETILN